MARQPERTGNHLFDALDYSTLSSILRRTEELSFDREFICYKADVPIQDIYFPKSCVISWVQNAGEGRRVEVATVGNEGFLGVPILLGADRTPGTSFCQIPGEGFKISVCDFHEFLTQFPEFFGILNRYVQALIVQIAQGNACNALHNVEERCARWLLSTLDRVGKSTFLLTQDFLAQMLAVRRTGVNEVAQTFQDAGLIRYVRGEITILNRPALEARSCVCYGIVRNEFRRMLKDLGE